MRLRGPLVLCAAILACAPRVASAAFPVAEPTAFPVSLGSSELYSSVATDDRGNSVVVWTRIASPGSEVVARLFDPQGKPLSRILRVSPNGWLPVVAMNARGTFAVAWRDTVATTPDGGSPIRVQLFAPGGARVGPVTQVNPTVAPESTLRTIAIDRRGHFAVAWSSATGGVSVRRFDPAGEPVGPEVRTLPDGGISSSLALRPDGSFLLVWLAEGALVGRPYGADGEPAGEEFPVSQEAVDSLQSSSVAATADGGFVVTWNLCETSPVGPPGVPGAPSPCEVRARRFDAEAHAETAELVVSPGDGRTNVAPVVVADDGRGYFAVSWHSCLGFDGCQISTQVFSPRNVPAARVETVSIGADYTVSPALAVSPAGFVVVFRSALCTGMFPACQKTDPFGIYGWHFNFPVKSR